LPWFDPRKSASIRIMGDASERKKNLTRIFLK
jgi:hypothetical protein